MKSDARISELLVKTGAYTDLDEPVILTSGELGIYYVNTERLVQDGGEWKKYGDDAEAMIKHAIKMTTEHPTFGEVIDILAKKARDLTKAPKKHFDDYFISGGQRRDWLFSGPVANKLNLAHISIYKDGKITHRDNYFENTLGLHISDLLTEASSCYRKEGEEEKGWIPSVRGKGAETNDLITVVTRLQGGEQRLKSIGINTHASVAIDEDFASQHSKDPNRAMGYMRNPGLWSEYYLRVNGALALIETFNPEAGKLDRAKKFLDRYGSVLVDARKAVELDREVAAKYGTHLKDIQRGD
jgi:hypothetical protein